MFRASEKPYLECSQLQKGNKIVLQLESASTNYNALQRSY